MGRGGQEGLQRGEEQLPLDMPALFCSRTQSLQVTQLSKKWE